MKRGLVTRRISVVVLVSIAALLALATAPLLFGVGIDDAVRRGSDLLAIHTGGLNIERPVRLQAYPNVVVSSGEVSIVRSGVRRSATLTLDNASIDIALGGQAASGDTPVASLFDRMGDGIAREEIDKIALRHATLTFRWSSGEAWAITDCDAEISARSSAAISVSGDFTHLGQRLKFELSTTGPFDANRQQLAGARWPLKLSVTSPLLGVTIDGELDTRGAWSLKAQTEVRTPDTTRLAAGLGYGWGSAAIGPGLLVRGPATWERGVIAFGKSHISLGDQDGVGALSLSLRDNRPLIEATAAFPALDIAPLLYVGYVPEFVPASGAIAAIAPAVQLPVAATWRGLATHFPAMAIVDTELRLSAGRLQWRGEPIGHGAFTVSARTGMVHADFAELSVGSHVGSLQIQMDQTLPHAPVTLRGRFKSANVAELVEALFASAFASGPSVAQFELTGHGATLGDVVDRAVGRGMLEARDGQIDLDATALQKLIAAPLATGRPLPWSAIAARSAYQTLGLKFQVRSGVVTIDAGTLRSNGLVTSVFGQVDLPGAKLDLSGRIDAQPPRLTSVARSNGRTVDDVLTLRGPWTAPVVSMRPIDPLP